MEQIQNPFIKVSDKKNKKKQEVNSPPTNQGGSMNPNEVTPQNSVQEGKTPKEIGHEKRKAKIQHDRKQLRDILPQAAAISRSMKGLPPDPGVTARWKKPSEPLSKDKVSSYEKDAASFRNVVSKPTREFSVHPQTAAALGMSNTSKPSVSIKQRLTPKRKGIEKQADDADVVKYPKYKLKHEPIKHIDQHLSDFHSGKAPLNRNAAMMSIAHSRSTSYARSDAQIDRHRARHELSTRSFEHEPDSFWERQKHQARSAIDKEHDAKEHMIHSIFDQHARHHNEPYHAHEISSEGYIRGNTVATTKAKKGIFSRLKRAIGMKEEKTRLEVIKTVVEARNMFRSAGAGQHRGGGVIRRKGSTGRQVNAVQMYSKAKRQVTKGLKDQSKGQQQSASLNIAKQKTDHSAEVARAKGSQFRIN